MAIDLRMKKQLLAVLLLLVAAGSQAQLNNCNVFLKGKYLEAGINWNGAFGTSAHPPYGYHADVVSDLHNSLLCGGAATSDTALGFVADRDMDGWNNGTPGYYGDFILPGGAPQEGWSYQADLGSGPVQLNSWNHDAVMSGVFAGDTCSNQTYTDTNGVMQTKWQGVTGGVYITQITTLDTSKLYVTVQVYIENTSLAPVQDIYYMRTINPHNDALLSGSLATVNKIDYQYPDTMNRCMVSARGTVHNNAYLLLATQDNRAIAFLDKTGQLPTANTLDNIYNMDPANFYYGLQDSTTDNTSMGIIFSLGVLTSGNGTNFTFIYGFSPAVVDSAISSAVHTITPAAHDYRVFPNPTANNFRVTGMEPGDKLVLYDMMGRRMDDLTVNSGMYTMGDALPGSYALLVTDHTGIIKSRMMIQKK